jgi:hypothetical protein
MRGRPLNLITRVPSRPYRNLLWAALIGVPLGILVVSVFQASVEATSLARFFVRVADTLPVSFFVYPLMAVLVLFYGMPLLWLALRFRKAGPATALLIALLPCVGMPWPGDSLSWLALTIAAATGLVFVLLAYRGSPGSTVAPHPGSG